LAEALGAAAKVRKLYQDHLAFWQPRREAMTECEEFLLGDRYVDDHGAYSRDRRLVQIRGQEVQDTIRHVAAKATEKPRSVEARPRDELEDPQHAEYAAALVEFELGNPWKSFDDYYEAAILSARSMRLGIVWMDWVPDCAPFGEIIYSYGDPRRYMWDPAYESPHHPLCGWLIREKRLEVEVARETYGAKWLEPDRDAISKSGQPKPGVPLLSQGSDRMSAGSTLYKDNKCTILECWYKNDRTVKGPESGDYSPIDDPEDRYMVCASGCGYRSETQGQLRDAGKVDVELPEMIPQGCPTCGGELERIDAEQEEKYSLAYAKGKRLVVIAGFSAAPEDRPLYDGSWPIPKARSFPGLFLTAYQKPGEPTGPCDVDLMWDQQIASDNLRTMAVQRTFEHRNYWVLPKVGLTDYRGQRFKFREDQFNVMYRDDSLGMGNLTPTLINGTGLDPQWPIAFNAVQAALTQYRGVTDLGLSPENTKNIAASTVAQLNQLGEIPTAHFNRRKNRELGKFYGVAWDYIRATYTRQRLARLNLDGMDVLANLEGDELPNFDFVLSDTPEFTGLEKGRSEAFQALLQVAMNPLTQPFIDLFAEINNLPPSVVRKLKKTLELQQQAAAAALPVMDGGGSSPGVSPPPNGNGAGMMAAAMQRE
jgi:hypothetical protein